MRTLEAESLKPELWSDPSAAQKTLRETNTLKTLLQKYDRLESSFNDLGALDELCREAGGEAEWAEMARGVADLKTRLEDMVFRAKLSGPMDAKNAIVSLHAGAGGTESCDWAEMLFRMYTRWAEKNGFSVEVTSLMPGEGAGYKRAEFMVSGEYAYGNLKSEIGVHRLVRISPFDANARRHTSFAACDVIPEIDDDIPVDIKEADLKIDTFRSGGAGGQHVNKTESGVRFTHLPSGVVTESTEARSQHQNREIALQRLYQRLQEMEYEKVHSEIASRRKSIVGSGDRSEKIRTYNYPQNRLTDHRINLTLYNLDAVMDGRLEEIIEALQIADTAEKLKAEAEG